MTQSTQFDPRAWVFADENTTNQMPQNQQANAPQQPVLDPQEGVFGGKPSTLPANFDPQEWVFRNVQDKDVTGMGTKYGEYFNSQVAKQRAAQQGRLDPVWIDNQFQHHLGEMEKFYTLQGFSPAQIEKIKAEFNQASNLAEQGAWYEKAWDHASDLAKSTAAATSGLTADVIGAFAPESEWHRDWKETRDVYANALSDRGLIGLNRQDQEFAQRMANGENEALAKFQSLWNHPLATANQATQVIPQVALAAATGGLSLGAVNAAASAGSYREEIRNAWKNLSPEQAMQMPQIQQRMAQGMTLEQAIEDASTDLSDNLAGIGRAAAIGGIDAISPLGKLGKGVNSGMLKTFGKEVTKEAAQEAIEQGNRNYGVGQIDGKTQLMDNVQASAVAGAVLGVPTGAISAYDAYRNDSQAKRQSEAVQNALEVESENAAPTPNQTEKAAQQFDENVLDETLSVIEDEQLRKDYKEELENDIKDGLIAERAKENSTYGKLAKAYLQATNPQQEIETEQVAKIQPEAKIETEGLTQEQLDKQRAADLRSRMERWLNEEKVDDISDVISTPMTFTDDKAKVTFATRTAFGEIQRLAERNGIDPNDGNAIREWIEQDSEPHITITAEDIDKAQAQDNAQSSVQAQPYAQDNAQSSAQRKADVKNSNHSEFESLDPNEKAKYNRQLERIRKTYNINQADKEAEESTFRYLHSYGVGSDLYADKSNLHKAIAEQIKGFGYDKDSKRGYVGYNNEDGIVSVQGFLLDQKNTTGNAARTDSNNTATVIPMPSSPIGRAGKYQQSMSDEPLNKVYKLNKRSTFKQIASIYDEAVTKAISSAAYTNAPRLQASFLYSLPLNVLNKLAKEFDQTGANSSSGKGFQFSPFASVANHKAELIKAGGNKAVQGWIKRAKKEEKLAEQAYKQLTSNPKQEKNNVDKQTSSVARNSQNTTDSAAQTRYSRSPIKSVEANIKRGREAMNTAIVERRTVHRAMYNHNLDGWVDFEWGDDGLNKPLNKKGEPIGKGISHIIEARMRKDGMGYEQATRMLTQDIVDTIARGTVAGRWVRNNGDSESVQIDYNGHRAGLIRNKGSNAWLLTAFELHSDKGKSGRADTAESTLARQELGSVGLPVDANSAGSVDTERATHTKPTLTRQGEGATGLNTVQQTTTQSNNQSHSDSVNIEQDRQFLQNTLGDVANQIELVSRADLQGHKQSAEGFFENGKAHLVTDNIKGDDVFSREERLAWVAWHELGHNGVNVRFSANHKNLMEFTRTNPVVNTLRRKIQQRYADMNIHINDDVATEEAIVELYAASQTNDWAKLEQDYNLRVHHSWKTGENSVRTFIENVVNKLRKIVGAVLKKDLSKATTADILSLLKQLNQDPHTENVSLETEQDTRYSLNESADSEFAKAVDAVAQGGSVKGYIDVGTTPDVLKILGLPDVKVTIHGATFKKVMQDKHHITAETLKQLPEQINDPVAVMKSAPQATQQGYVILTELVEDNPLTGGKEPVVSALHLKQDANGLEIINIASVYGKNLRGLQNMLNHDLLYWNNKKGSDIVDTFGLQLPAYVSQDSPIAANIKTELDLSQYKNGKEARFSQRENQDLSEQRYNQAKENGETELSYSQWKQVRSPAFKAWFGDWENDPENASKVINPKTGEPLVVYHGTSANFNVFDPEKQKNYRNQYGGGFYFTGDPDVAKLFGDNVMPVFLNARIGLAEKRLARRKGQSVELDHLRPNDSRDIWVVYNPNQVKSATTNNGEFSTENDDIRYSSRQSVDDLVKTGKAKAEPGLFDDLKAKDWEGFKKRINRATSKLDEWFADSLRPVNDWIDEIKGIVPEHIAEQLKGDMYRAKGVRDALNSELEQAYLKPLLRKLAEIASKEGPSGNKSNELDVKRLVGFWLSARYSIERNQRYLVDEKKKMEDAEEALHEAEAQDDPDLLDKARDAYRKAERQYRYRKADVESTNFGSNVEKNFKVGTAGGFSIPHARALMKRIETYVSRKDLESVAELVYDLNQARLLIDLNSGRFTQEAYDEYKKDRHYVPLTGDPRADDGFDFIGGAGQNALNIAKDKAHKGRKTSEAEDAIDATWKAVGKTTAYAGMVDFKNRLDEIYENEFHRLREEGFSERSAKEQVEETLGISKKKMQGTTRTSDNVLIRKQGHSYYEYHLPNDVIRALKRDNVEQVHALLRLISKPTGWYARGVTQWTLTFSPQNMLRDTWEKSEFIRVQKLYRNGKKVDDATMDRIGRGVLKYAFSDKGLWTATKRFGFGQALREDVEDERLLKRLLELGGVSTYSTYLARTEKDLVKKVKAENSGLGKRLEQVGTILEGYNKTFDTVSSLAAFKSLIKNGIDEKQAAAITLELTNFRKQGSAMAPIKALYMFSQPTAMGARNLYKFLSHPKGRKRFFAYMAVMMPFYLALRAFDDEDEGGNKMDQLGDISRYIPIPAELGKYIKLPVGFGMPQLAWNFSVNLVKALTGDISNSEAAVNMLVHTMKTFAPISPSEISAAKYPIEKVAMTATPTILQPLMQIALNRNAFGSQITTNFVRDDKLKAEQAKSTTAQFWKDVALQVHDVFGIDAHPEQIKNLFDGYGSIFGSLKEVQTIFVENPNRELLGRNKRTPFFNQLYGAGNEFAIMSRYYEASDEAQSLFKEYESRKARGKLDGWLTPQKRAMIQFHQIDKKRMAELRAEKSKLTRDLNKGRLTPAGYEARLKLYNQKTDKLQRILLKRWREMNGLNTH
ncbi:LPD38 domain-containing protein [Avibacterium avium]|uniref:MuF-C-terminal domain-containing protein n=1 Tax=Avibacterium avium TaxID=751 RepID=UPI003BF799EC